jgi:hypothetical protein
MTYQAVRSTGLSDETKDIFSMYTGTLRFFLDEGALLPNGSVLLKDGKRTPLPDGSIMPKDSMVMAVDHSGRVPRSIVYYFKRPWQRLLMELLSPTPMPDNRCIIWVMDVMGNRGKSTFLKWLQQQYGAVQLGGKEGDALFGAQELLERDHPIAVFDFARSKSEYISYGSIENIKNGNWFSGKYASKGVSLSFSPHLVVFANRAPEAGRFTGDKVHLLDLDHDLGGIAGPTDEDDEQFDSVPVVGAPETATAASTLPVVEF